MAELAVILSILEIWLVMAKATDLATIEQIDPIYVYFNLNELDLIKIREAARKDGWDFNPEY